MVFDYRGNNLRKIPNTRLLQLKIFNCRAYWIIPLHFPTLHLGETIHRLHPPVKQATEVFSKERTKQATDKSENKH